MYVFNAAERLPCFTMMCNDRPHCRTTLRLPINEFRDYTEIGDGKRATKAALVTTLTMSLAWDKDVAYVCDRRDRVESLLLDQ